MSEKGMRCAIYTRKSHAEGLDQAFNSLDAQREAGVDYVKSQKHEGWSVLRTHYDDGGYSGATMERPALKRLFEDIDCGAIDLVVVYKVDRLSRSIGDFAQMMERFDEHGVSFVSVTQQFNTTTSMGRLTLNMLLSFAQFERDIAGERIRDKLAATKKKGMWVSGPPPLGYRLRKEGEDRKLHVLLEEAALVRKIFAGYLEAPSLVELALRLNAEGHTTKRWETKAGHLRGGQRLTRKYIHSVLTNPTYLGKIPHTEAGERRNLPGLHEALIDERLWGEVHELMEKKNRQSRHRWTQPYLLKGKLRTGDDFAMSPGSVHRQHKAGGKRLVRYYVSQKAIQHGYRACAIKTMNARHMDDLIRALVLDYLASLSFPELTQEPIEVQDHWIREVLDGVVLTPEKLVVRLDTLKVAECREKKWDGALVKGPTRPTCPYEREVETRGKQVVITLRIQIKRLDGRRLILSPEGHDLVLPSEPQPKEHIVSAIALAYRWHEELVSSKRTLSELAQLQDLSESWIRRLLPLTHLGPEILKAALTGFLPPSLTLNDLLAAAENLDWSKQSRALGLKEQAGLSLARSSQDSGPRTPAGRCEEPGRPPPSGGPSL